VQIIISLGVFKYRYSVSGMQVAHDKLAKSKVSPAPAEVLKGPAPSPFTARRSETEVFASRRRSFFTTDAAALAAQELATSPEEGASAEDVMKRAGRGLTGDVLKEMKVRQEKRASVIPRTGGDFSGGVPRTGGEFAAERPPAEEENPFCNVKLR
jgi:hypothetical protein